MFFGEGFITLASANAMKSCLGERTPTNWAYTERYALNSQVLAAAWLHAIGQIFHIACEQDP